MRPKKRKAPNATTDLTSSSKRLRIGDADTIDQKTASGRPRGSSGSEPQYNFTRKRQPASSAKKEGNDTKATAMTKRGTDEVKRGRGRPSKAMTVRKGKKSVPVTAGRGILKNEKTSDSQGPVEKKGNRGTSVTAKSASPIAKNTSSSTGKKKGRPSKTNAKAGQEEPVTTVIALSSTKGAAADEEADKDGIQYWLMKAEPESRVEKGWDVKFSIDDLAAKTEPEGWDGVRNPVARNNMRAMRVNDLAFFYHSNCKIPGVAGVMRIVEEHSVDESAFDPDHPYYDPKSDRAKPKWELVKVEFVKKFDELVTLKDLRKFAEKGGKLQNMAMLKQGRLSVSAVRGEEWRFILDLADEPHDLGQQLKEGGNESDTDEEMENEDQSAVKTDGKEQAEYSADEEADQDAARGA